MNLFGKWKGILYKDNPVSGPRLSQSRNNFRPSQDDDDLSDSWSLPNYPEFQKQRQRRAEKMRRMRRARKRSQPREEQDEDAKYIADALGGSVVSQPDQLKDLMDPEEGDDHDEDDDGRGKWNNSVEFLLSIISMSVGMGNFYRFPFVAYQNGGGAFLIPYIIILTFVGRPMYFMELAVGQFCSFGQVKCWEMSPFFRGVGYGSALGSFCVVTYYSSVMAVTLFYLFNSFRSKLPWSVCDPSWAGESICDMITNATLEGKNPKMLVNLPQLYFEKEVMKELPNIDHGIGLPQWKQVLCLLLSWVIIFTVIVRGVQSSGKVAYVTTIYPYCIILTMLITACTQAGAFEGMLYFITPDWSRIGDLNVWFAAAGQCFFSLSTGFGPIINYASYNPFNHPIYKDAMIVSFMDTMTSFIAGLAVFATLGNLSHQLNKPISEVVSGGPGLVFISFSDAIANFKYAPQVFSVLFFLMLLTLAIGSAVAWQMACISVISDQFPSYSKSIISVVMCLLGFLIALIYVTPGGQFMVTLVDNFGGNINIYILATLECIGIAWVYGLKNFVRDLEFMLGHKLGFYWKLCWGFVVPVLLTFIMVYSFATAKRLEHNGVPFPDSAIACGWCLTAISILFVPIGAGYAMYKSSGTLRERFLNSFKPTEEFGPKNASDKENWELFKEGKFVPNEMYDKFEASTNYAQSTHTLPAGYIVVPPGTELLIQEEEADAFPKKKPIASSTAVKALANAPILP